MCFGQYETGERKARYIVRTMYYNKKYSIMAKPANRQHSLLYKYLQQWTNFQGNAICAFQGSIW